jgi:hypothetical protein
MAGRNPGFFIDMSHCKGLLVLSQAVPDLELTGSNSGTVCNEEQTVPCPRSFGSLQDELAALDQRKILDGPTSTRLLFENILWINLVWMFATYNYGVSLFLIRILINQFYARFATIC